MLRVALFLCAWLASCVACADAPVGITAELPYVDVEHAGKTFRIQRDPDNLGQIDSDYALTSRPCPPFCIQPMQLAPGVETLGELEFIGYLKRASQREDSVLVIDSREPEWVQRTGVIPGAVHLPWTRLHANRNDAESIAEILEFTFGAMRNGPLWNFQNAKTLVLYCNGVWCGQSPTNIRQLLAVGYPAHKLKWYRGGMQSWKSLGLPSVPAGGK
jgi:rhodanese-related sulfurtransferase